MNKKVPFYFIDLFSGAGGLSCGLELAGMTCLLGVDMDKNALETFKHNHLQAKIFHGPIAGLSSSELKKLTHEKKIHAIVGGPPCQGFSTVGLGDPNDTRNHLFKEFIRIVKIVNPEFVVIENVTGLLAKKNEKTMSAIFKIFSKMGYIIDVQVMSAENYGVPEKRRRTIILGSKINQKIIFPKTQTHIVTVGEALRDLKNNSGGYYNHDVKLAEIKSPLEKKRVSHIPEGQGIRYEADEKKYFKTKELKLEVDWNKLKENRFRQTKYQRLHRKKPSPTIMTHRHNYFHPTKNRYLTQREAAAIQSFPNDFKFFGPLSAQWKQIGNAVPPLLGKAIGEVLLKMYKEKKTRPSLVSQKDFHRKTVLNIRKKAFHYKKSMAS